MKATKQKTVRSKSRRARKSKAFGLHGADIVWRYIPGKGRGVFATKAIKKGEIVEVAPAVPMAKKDVPEGDPPDGYVLDWDEKNNKRRYALVLGYIMLYNHSDTPNMSMDCDLREKTYTATAIRNIKAGDELTWDYGVELWFKAK
jgi:SET domain-containing protein